MFLGIQEPPKCLREILGVVADAFDVIQIFGRNRLEDFAHARHRDLFISITRAGRIEVITKVAHELAAFGLARLARGPFDPPTDMLHGHTRIVQNAADRIQCSQQSLLQTTLATPWDGGERR